MRFSLPLGIILILVTVSACSTPLFSEPDVAHVQKTEKADPLPELAGLSGIASRSGSIAGSVRMGHEVHLASTNVEFFESSLALNPPFQQLSYAVYKFSGSSDDVVESLMFVTSNRVVGNTPVYIAISNYGRGRWEYLPVFTEDTGQVALNPTSGPYFNASGDTYVALLAFSGDSYVVESVELVYANRSLAEPVWPTEGGSNLRQRRSTLDVVETAAVYWKAYSPDSFAFSAPCQDSSGKIYLGAYTVSDGGRLYALNVDGSPAWSFGTLGPVAASPAVSPVGHIYVGDTGSYMHSLNAGGKRSWLLDVTREVYSAPAIDDDGNVYLGTPGQELFKVGYAGNVLWSADTGTGVYGPPAIGADGTVYVCTAGGELIAISPSGSLLWKHEGEGEAHGSPCIADDSQLFYATQAGNFYAVNADGTQAGSEAVGGMFETSPALGHDGNLYIGNTDGSLYVFDSTASQIDSFDAGAPIEASCVIDGDGTVFLATTAGRILALTPELNVQWEYSAQECIRADPAIISSGVLLFASSAGTLYAFGANDPYPPERPTGLQASDGNYSDKIVLSWNEGFDANGYWIYKDGGTEPVDEVGYVQSWIDEPVPDNDTHSYQIRAINEHGESPISEAETGYTGLPQLAPWSQARGNPARTNAASNLGPQSEPTESRVDFGHGNTPSPVTIAADGTYYIKAAGTLYAYDADGTEKWTYSVTYGDESPPMIGLDGNIVFPLNGGTIEAVTPLGVHDWYYAPVDTTSINPIAVGDDGTIFALGGYEPEPLLLHAINSDGTEKWTYEANQDMNYCTPAVGSDGTLYLPDRDNQLLVIDADGNYQWEVYDSLAADGLPCIKHDVAGDLMYVNTNDGLRCFDYGGEVQWTYPRTGYVNLSPSGLIFLCCYGEVVMLNASGTEVDSLVIDNGFSNANHSVVDSGNILYIIDNSDVIHALSTSLEVMWSLQTMALFDSNDCGPAIHPDGRLILNASNTYLCFYGVQ